MIINYCSGGLGNRLKPLSSCYVISKITGRPLGTIWNPTKRCGCKFDDLFENDIKNVSFEELINSNSVTIYSYNEWVEHDYKINGNDQLKKLVEKFGVHPVSNSANIIKDDKKYIIVYSNSYLGGYPESECKEFFDKLVPISKLREEISNKIEKLKLDKSVIGVHARGTDFEPGGVTVETYVTTTKNLYNEDRTRKIFVCSDSKAYEEKLLSCFPKNVILNHKNNYVYKVNDQTDWTNNVQTPVESVQEALVDMYLLSKTDFKVFHKDSTFAHTVLMLSK